MSLDRLHQFNDLLTAYQGIERMVYVRGTDRLENDVEHSYLLTMLAWYLIEKDKLKLDVNRVIKYALIHDLVEVYAGDTYVYDKVARATKKKREAAAAKRLADEYSDFETLHTLIEEYERQDDPESRFVKALDKLHPMLCIYADEGRFWKEKGVTVELMIETKQETFDRSPEVKPYFDMMIELLRSRPDLFETHKA